MLLQQDCVTCQAQCDPAQHLFTEVQYTPSPDNSPSLVQSLNQLLIDHGVQPVNVGSSGSNFLTGGAPADHAAVPDTAQVREEILRAVASGLDQSSMLSNSSIQQGVPTTAQPTSTAPSNTTNTTPTTGQTNTTPSGGSNLENIMAQFLQAQLARDARQERRDQEITNLLSQAQSSSTDRPQTQSLPPTAGKVVVATLPNPQNAEYVGMALPTMYTVEGDVRTLYSGGSMCENSLKRPFYCQVP